MRCNLMGWVVCIVAGVGLSGCYDDIDIENLCHPSDPECAHLDFDDDGVLNPEDDFPADGACSVRDDDNCSGCGEGCGTGFVCNVGDGACMCAPAPGSCWEAYYPSGRGCMDARTVVHCGDPCGGSGMSLDFCQEGGICSDGACMCPPTPDGCWEAYASGRGCMNEIVVVVCGDPCGIVCSPGDICSDGYCVYDD